MIHRRHPPGIRRTGSSRAWLIIAPAIAVLLGCASLAPRRAGPCVGGSCRRDMTVAVAAFEDQRPDEEFGSPVPLLAAVAQDMAVGVPAVLALLLADRLNREEFFLAATAVEGSASPPSPEFLARLADQGFDAVITGNLPRCMGTTCLTGGSKEGSYLYRLVSVTFFRLFLVIPPMGKLHNEATIALTEVRLTDTRSGEVLWHGDFTRQAMSHTSSPEPGEVVTEAMELVTGDILEHLRTEWGDRRRGIPGMRPGPRERP